MFACTLVYDSTRDTDVPDERAGFGHFSLSMCSSLARPSASSRLSRFRLFSQAHDAEGGRPGGSCDRTRGQDHARRLSFKLVQFQQYVINLSILIRCSRKKNRCRLDGDDKTCAPELFYKSRGSLWRRTPVRL